VNLKLDRLKNFDGRKGPLVLLILDGVGMSRNVAGNAFQQATTPVLDRLFTSDLYLELKAHGKAVGLPSNGDMGNSEVGHNALGAGRTISQGATLVNEAINNKSIYNSIAWNNVIKAGKLGHTVHFIGLLSDGNVHSHIEHLFSMINKCVEEKISKIRIHALIDGRDVLDRTAPKYIEMTESLLSEINIRNQYDYQIASGGGRMNVTMDRYEADWDVVKRGWNTHVLGQGRKFNSASEAVNTYYSENPDINDQYLDPFVIMNEDGVPVGTIQDGDSVVYFNFRGDRAIEISRAFEEKAFNKFDRVFHPNVFYAGMMQYDGDLNIPNNYLVSPPKIDRTISEYLCNENIRSFAISETQKFGHVTYFWNGNKSDYISEELETYIEIPSDKIEFDKAPKMKAAEITAKTIELLETKKYQFGRINFANGDMVGHTGNMEAAIVACETVDTCVGKILKVVSKLNGIAIITADHGNVEEMFIEVNGERKIKTSHTLNPIPFAIYDSEYNSEYEMKNKDDYGITNIAATLLNLLGYKKVADYDESLIEFI